MAFIFKHDVALYVLSHVILALAFVQLYVHIDCWTKWINLEITLRAVLMYFVMRWTWHWAAHFVFIFSVATTLHVGHFEEMVIKMTFTKWKMLLNATQRQDTLSYNFDNQMKTKTRTKMIRNQLLRQQIKCDRQMLMMHNLQLVWIIVFMWLFWIA